MYSCACSLSSNPIDLYPVMTCEDSQYAGRTAYVSIRQHTAEYVSIRQHTSAYVSIRQHTSAYVSIRQYTSAYGHHTGSIRQQTSANVSKRQHTSAYVEREIRTLILECIYIHTCMFIRIYVHFFFSCIYT
jgi:hypothetical protein